MNGVLVINKPQNWTSHDVVNKARGLLQEKRIGHTGTLDPLATGVLVLCIGKATKIARYLEADDKEYIAELKLGATTDTLDSAGRVLATRRMMGKLGGKEPFAEGRATRPEQFYGEYPSTSARLFSYKGLWCPLIPSCSPGNDAGTWGTTGDDLLDNALGIP